MPDPQQRVQESVALHALLMAAADKGIPSTRYGQLRLRKYAEGSPLIARLNVDYFEKKLADAGIGKDDRHILQNHLKSMYQTLDSMPEMAKKLEKLEDKMAREAAAENALREARRSLEENFRNLETKLKTIIDRTTASQQAAHVSVLLLKCAKCSHNDALDDNEKYVAKNRLWAIITVAADNSKIDLNTTIRGMDALAFHGDEYDARIGKRMREYLEPLEGVSGEAAQFYIRPALLKIYEVTGDESARQQLGAKIAAENQATAESSTVMLGGSLFVLHVPGTTAMPSQPPSNQDPLKSAGSPKLL